MNIISTDQQGLVIQLLSDEIKKIPFLVHGGFNQQHIVSVCNEITDGIMNVVCFQFVEILSSGLLYLSQLN